MGRTPIRARDTPGFVANRLARPFALESLRMLGDGRRRRGDDRPRRPPRRRLPDGPVRADRPDRPRRQPHIARSFFAQGGEPERWRPSPIQERLVEEGKLGRKSGQGYYAYGDGRPARRRTRSSGIAAPTLDPEELAADRPGRGRDPAPALRPDRQRGRLRAGRRGRLARRHGDGDAARPQLAAGPARHHPADRRRPARSSCCEALEAEHGSAYRPAPRLLAAAEAGRRERRPQAGLRPTPPRATARRSRRCRPTPRRTSPTRPAASSPPSSRRGSRTSTATSSGTSSPTTSSRASARRPPTPASGARAG